MSTDLPGVRFSERFDANRLGRNLHMRTRMPGDRFQPLGMDRDKSLKDFMIDTHIPQRWRDRIPLVDSSGRIAWVVGWYIADWAKVRDDTQRVLEITFRPSGA
jgi:tRNA(Ile)-lysidine synthase